MTYDLELNKAIKQIKLLNKSEKGVEKPKVFQKKQKAKLVCIQLPDGLKRYAKQIQQEIEKNTSATVLIWLGSCFGSCDVPENIERLGVDLLIQWGHSKWKF